MDTEKKPWLPIVVFLLAGLLSLWGMACVWTAAELLPEKGAAPETASGAARLDMSSEISSETKGDALPILEEKTAARYAVGRHKRNRPLSDPFRAEAIALPKGQMGGIPAAALLPAVRLCGIMTAGEDRRAMLRIGEMTQTWREGEGTAGWTVTEIGETEVHLSTPFGAQILTL